MVYKKIATIPKTLSELRKINSKRKAKGVEGFFNNYF